jgi:hemerythrin-like metal-binding protein
MVWTSPFGVRYPIDPGNAIMPNTIEIFPWNENFATGIATIDAQHRKLITLLNTLVSHMAFQSEAPELNRIFGELKDYAAVHFQTEEAIWHRHFQGDAWELGHQHAHTDFVAQVIQLKSEEDVKPLDEVIEGIVTFLTHWLALHIIESDKRMAKVVLALPAAASLAQAKTMADAQMSGATRALIETVMVMYDKMANHTLRMTREIFMRQRTEQALRQAHEALRVAKEQAEAANRSKSEFLATISHELRTPLQGLLGFAEVLTLDGISASERAECADFILKSGQSLVAMVDDVLSHAKVEAGKVELIFSECQPQVLVNDVLALFSKAAQSKGLGLALSLAVPPGQSYLMDPVRVRQMLTNLISNAIKFTKAGVITVAVEESDRSDGTAMLRFSVTDTGCGIKKESQGQLFQRFEQVNSASTQHGGGSGLGLSIVKGLASLMGGAAGLQSQENQGTMVWFSLRARLGANPARRDPDQAV